MLCQAGKRSPGAGSDFRVVPKNDNDNLDSPEQVTDQDTVQDNRLQKLILFCEEPRTREERMVL